MTQNDSRKPLRIVTRKCAGCGGKFPQRRSDAKYCSGACRQQAHRARQNFDDLDRAIEQARLIYWRLIAEKAHALGRRPSEVLTTEAQYVDLVGDVWIGGVLNGTPWRRLAGHTKPGRPGWEGWGLEAAGPPWCPPGEGYYEKPILGKAAYQQLKDGRDGERQRIERAVEHRKKRLDAKAIAEARGLAVPGVVSADRMGDSP